MKRHQDINSWRLSSRIAGAFVALFAMSGMAQQAQALEKIVLGQAATTSLTFGTIFAGMELGYFKDEGIELQIQDFQGASILLTQVANKSITIGYPGPEPLIISHQPGRSAIPAKFFYLSLRESIWEYIVREDSPLKSIADLRGKIIGVGSLGNANVPIIRAMLKEQGLKPNDYSFTGVGIGAPSFHATITKEIDVLNTHDTNAAAFYTTGAKIRELPTPDKYRHLFSNGFIAHVDTLKERPDLFAGFGRAVAKATVFCAVNPGYCVASFYRQRPSLKPAGASDQDVLEKGKLIFAARMKKHMAFDPGEPHVFGSYSAQKWRNLIQALYDGGEISTPNIDASTMYTGDLLAKINDFDVAKIEEAARNKK